MRISCGVGKSENRYFRFEIACGTHIIIIQLFHSHNTLQNRAESA